MPIFYDAKPKPEGNYDATVYVGGLDERVTKRLLWELFIQVGPVVHVNMPRDRIAGTHQGYGFVEFEKEVDAEYAIKIFNMIKVFGKPIRLNKSATGGSRREMDVGAKLFVGNLDADVDEKFLFDTFSAFGTLLNVPKVMRDPETGRSRGFGFVNFTSFGAADMALAAMNGQHLCNRPITCSYAFKKDGEGAEERHGSEAERLLAERNPLRMAAPTTLTTQPHMMFAPLQQPPSPYNSVPPPPSYMQQQVMSMQPMMMPPPMMGFTQGQMDVDPTRVAELLPPPPPPPPPPSVDD